VTYREAIQYAVDQLHNAGIPDARMDAYLLLEFTTGLSRKDYLMQADSCMDEVPLAKFKEALARRSTREPLQHITGVQEFMGITYHVNAHVLIPRQDTELLVEKTLEVIQRLIAHNETQAAKTIRYLDLCTGSGCIPISVAKHAAIDPARLEITASDISPQALEVAAHNVSAYAPCITLLYSDLYDQVVGEYDIITSNPPYIVSDVIPSLESEVKDFDPLLALDGGIDGLDFYRRIIDESRHYLVLGGTLLLEIGYDQGQAVHNLMFKAGYEQIEIIKDLAGEDRVVMGVREHDY